MIDTLEEIEARLERIRASATGYQGEDDEAAHARQDALLIGVLEGIAAGAWGDASPEELASAALRVQEIDFCRWYA